MNGLRLAMDDYLTLRRGLGYKLEEAQKLLSDFVAYLERHNSSFVTTKLSLEWATLTPTVASPDRKATRRDAVERLVAKYAAIACRRCPSLKEKHVSPHVLRHTTAVDLLRGGVDRTVIALWLGHESPETTNVYLHADLSIKEQALARTAPRGTKPGRFRPDDSLLSFLAAL